MKNEETSSSGNVLHSSFYIQPLFEQRLRVEIIGFDVLKVAISADFQFVGGCIVTDNHAFLMRLQSADGPHLHNGAFNGMIESACLVVPVDDNHHFLGTEHGAYAYGQSRLGHLVDIVVEETGVGDDGVQYRRKT